MSRLHWAIYLVALVSAIAYTVRSAMALRRLKAETRQRLDTVCRRKADILPFPERRIS